MNEDFGNFLKDSTAVAETLNGTDPNLSAFRIRGGKMLNDKAGVMLPRLRGKRFATTKTLSRMSGPTKRQTRSWHSGWTEAAILAIRKAFPAVLGHDLTCRLPLCVSRLTAGLPAASLAA